MGGRLEGRPRARLCQRPSFETPCRARLLRMRSVGGQFYPLDLISFMESETLYHLLLRVRP
jgi:hypothetical protein